MRGKPPAPAPSPQPRSPGRGSGPRAAPGSGIRAQIRRRSVLATQMSWIGKWGWGEETDPAIPEGGSARRWGLGGSWGWAGTLGLQIGGKDGHGRAGTSGDSLGPSSIFPSATGAPTGLQLPLPAHCTHQGLRPAAPSALVATWLPTLRPRVPQGRFAAAGTPRAFYLGICPGGQKSGLISCE